MITFRKAELNDIEKLHLLVNSAYRGDSSKKGWTTEADLLGGQRTDPEGLKEMINTADAQIELALSEGVILGCVYVRNESDAVYFGMLTVNPELQTQGLGKELLKRVEELTRAWGKNIIRMTVIGQRQELIAFYERRGYQRTGKTEPFPDHDPRFGLPKTKLLFHEFMKKLD
ncbi:MAG: GNAT family N-acetyltransferase [Bacteriovoracaceae bacterium]|nr:GNAT family N-acetyltransferase [Bacteriovoracaceae bacterium]